MDDDFWNIDYGIVSQLMFEVLTNAKNHVFSYSFETDALKVNTSYKTSK